MGSGSSSHKSAVGVWADLPPELLSLISTSLENPSDIIRFRSVCRSWRSSTSLPPNKISPFFPLTLPYTSWPRWCHKNLTINATAVYLLRPRSDPSRVRMVSVREPVAGKLFMRHALMHEKFPGGNSNSNLLDLSSGEWISATQIARSYAYDKVCDNCMGSSRSMKLTFVHSNSHDDNPEYGCDQLVGLCQAVDCYRGLLAFIRAYDNRIITKTRMHTDRGSNWDILDFVNFKGKIYAVDYDGVHEFDHKNLRLIQWGCGDLHNVFYNRKNFVVSEGDLYAVLRRREDDDHPACYRLVRECEWERVWDLGNRVLFITNGCSFFVSARDLPHPWKGNCIVFADTHVNWCAFCAIWEGQRPEIKVFQLGGRNQRPTFRPISLLQGYSELFDLPHS